MRKEGTERNLRTCEGNGNEKMRGGQDVSYPKHTPWQNRKWPYLMRAHMRRLIYETDIS